MPEFTTPPSIKHDPSGRVSLAAEISFETTVGATVTVIVSGDGSRREIQYMTGGTTHLLPLLGLKPDREYRIEVMAVDAADGTARANLELTTSPLPADFPPVEIRHCDANRREPGVILFSIGRGTRAVTQNPEVEFIVALDQTGDVVWFYRSEFSLMDVRRLESGNLLLMTTVDRILEIDMLGNTVNTWRAGAADDVDDDDGQAIPVAAHGFHHALHELPGGNIVALGHETRHFDDWYTSCTDPDAPKGRELVVGDVLTEFTRAGTVVNEIKLLDQLDPYRVVYNPFLPFWEALGLPGGRDWSHSNCVIHDASDDTLIVSSRPQDLIAKYKRETGELVWMLGPHANWAEPWQKYLLQPEGELEWQYHQHDPSLTPEGTLMLFDNGSFRATPFDRPVPSTENYSRAVEFEIDETAMTVRQVWAYGGPAQAVPYSTYISGALALPETGNRFVTFGGVIKDPDGKPADVPMRNHVAVYLHEVTRDGEPELLFEAVVDTHGSGDAIGWGAFKSIHLKSLYPAKLARES